MDKVIIDKVDVSGCVCYATSHVVMTSSGILIKDIDNACIPKQKPCAEIKNCMFKKQYKQLQRAKAENERLKEESKNYCIQLQVLAQALEDIRDIIDSRFKTAYMTLGYKEYDKLIEDIDKIVIEVIGAEE